MSLKTAKNVVQELLSEADIAIGGSNPWDIEVHNEDVYARILREGSLGLGESYMDGWWDVPELDQFFARALAANLGQKVVSAKFLAQAAVARILNMQSKRRSHEVAEKHYDLGNEFYEYMLGKHMQYTCAYWKAADNLEQAQENKLDLVCRKLQLKPGDKVLELGSGWGGFAKHAAEKYGCEVTAYNISKEQVAYSREYTKGLPVTFVQEDYREANGTFDKVVAIGVFEHVGYKNYRGLMEIAHRVLPDHGMALFHTIGRNTTAHTTDPFINKYIFPGGMLPSIAQVGSSFEKLFVMEDWHNFGPYYDKTLMAWDENFTNNWDKVKGADGKDEHFYRMWRYYLLSCAGSFRARNIQLWQVVLSKNGIPGGYKSIR